MVGNSIKQTCLILFVDSLWGYVVAQVVDKCSQIVLFDRAICHQLNYNGNIVITKYRLKTHYIAVDLISMDFPLILLLCRPVEIPAI